MSAKWAVFLLKDFRKMSMLQIVMVGHRSDIIFATTIPDQTCFLEFKNDRYDREISGDIDNAHYVVHDKKLEMKNHLKYANVIIIELIIDVLTVVSG